MTPGVRGLGTTTPKWPKWPLLFAFVLLFLGVWVKGRNKWLLGPGE